MLYWVLKSCGGQFHYSFTKWVTIKPNKYLTDQWVMTSGLVAFQLLMQHKKNGGRVSPCCSLPANQSNGNHQSAFFFFFFCIAAKPKGNKMLTLLTVCFRIAPWCVAVGVFTIIGQPSEQVTLVTNKSEAVPNPRAGGWTVPGCSGLQLLPQPATSLSHTRTKSRSSS